MSECEDKGVKLLKLNTDSMTIEDCYAFPEGYFASSPHLYPSLDRVQMKPIIQVAVILSVLLFRYPSSPSHYRR
jgi:hypothetical protein